MIPKPLSYTDQFLESIECNLRCLQLLVMARWPNGFVCPRCSCTRAYDIIEYRIKQCASCRYQVSPTAGTIFHRTRIPLRKWFVAIFLSTTDKTGVSAQRLHEIIGVSYKTAFAMLRKIRAAMGIELDQVLMQEVTFRIETILTPRESRSLRAIFLLAHKERADPLSKNQEHKSVDCQRNSTISSAASEERQLRLLVPGNPDMRLHQSKGPVEASCTGSQRGFLAAAVSLCKQFFLGTYHRSSTRYLQLYLDEFSYRFKSREPEAILQAFLARCALTSHSQIASYIRRAKSLSCESSEDGLKENIVSEPAASYSFSEKNSSPGSAALHPCKKHVERQVSIIHEVCLRLLCPIRWRKKVPETGRTEYKVKRSL